MLLYEAGHRHVLALARACNLLFEHRHHGRGGKVRAHVEGDLLRGDRISEKAEAEEKAGTIRAPALDGVKRISLEYLERRQDVGIDGPCRPVQLHGEGHRRTPGYGLLQSASDACVVGTEQLDVLAALHVASRSRMTRV